MMESIGERGGYLKERDYLENIFTDGIIILKWALNMMEGCGMH
jgi:hypothetical protein